MYSYDVILDNMLDASNSAVRTSLGVSLEDITGSGYEITQQIGNYAYGNGFNGIIAPSAERMVVLILSCFLQEE